MKIIVLDTSTPWILSLVLDSENGIHRLIHTEKTHIPKGNDAWMRDAFRSLEKYFSRENEDVKILLGRGPGSFTSLRVSFLFMQIVSDYYGFPRGTFSSLDFQRAGFSIDSDKPFFFRTNRNLYYASLPQSWRIFLNEEKLSAQESGEKYLFAGVPYPLMEKAREFFSRIYPEDNLWYNYVWEEPGNKINNGEPPFPGITMAGFSFNDAASYIRNLPENVFQEDNFAPFYGHTLEFMK